MGELYSQEICCTTYYLCHDKMHFAPSQLCSFCADQMLKRYEGGEAAVDKEQVLLVSINKHSGFH